MLNGPISLASLVAIFGLAATTAVTLQSLRRHTDVEPGLSVGWVMVSGGALLAAGGSLVHRVAGASGLAVMVAGLIVLGLAGDGRGMGGRRAWVGWAAITAAAITALAIPLPTVVWRGVFSIVLLVTVTWFARMMRSGRPRPKLGLAMTALAASALAIAAAAVVPWLATELDSASAVLLLVGFAAIAATNVSDPVGAELEALHGRVAALREDYRHATRLAETDPLTGCANRHALRAWFDAWEGGEPVSVALVDIDNLKGINDHSGTATGDEALRLVARVLRDSTRPDDLVARWGGDEFVVVLRGTRDTAAKRRFTSLIQTLQDAAGRFPHDEPLTVSWGVSSCSAAAEVALALSEADEHLNAMKRTG